MNGKVIIITGVAGSGKTTIGIALSKALNGLFKDGDDFHPANNIDKMSKGMPLTDEDRRPWLKSINTFIKNNNHPKLIIACSALKETYRRSLSEGIPAFQINWIHLYGDFDLIQARMRARSDHFMPLDLLKSQFAIYEQPQEGVIISINQPLEDIIQNIMSEIKKSDIGIVGLGVMGKSLARNIGSKGYRLSMYNRRIEGKEESIAEKAAAQYEELKDALAFEDAKDFVSSLSVPRKIILMVNAGKPVDEITSLLLPHLDQGDVIVDCGNSDYNETLTRQKCLSEKGFYFIGCGVSGGEEGALKGPAIMPGGNKKGYELIKDILEHIAARNQSGEICCSYIGEGGAGHFVKMIHNGIEYAEMQLIADMYAHLRFDQKMDLQEIADVFKIWCQSDSRSFLLEITVDILLKKDADGQALLDKIRDTAENKGTGGWTTKAACDLGVAIPTLTEALYCRYLSSDKKARELLAQQFDKKDEKMIVDLDELQNIYRFTRIINHVQGLDIIQKTSLKYDWQIDINGLLTTWSGGCIIRSELLHKLRSGLSGEKYVLQSKWIVDFMNDHWTDIKKSASQLIQSNQPYATVFSALEYFKFATIEKSSANIIQAQRDYFGAHTYQRIDAPDDQYFHTQWNNLD